MQIIVNNFADGFPSARLVVVGNCAFWFANKDLMGCKYNAKMYRYHPGGSYARRVEENLPQCPYEYSMLTVFNKKLSAYRPVDSHFLPEVYMFAGSGAKAFAVNFGHALIYFSYDKLIGINVYDKVYVLNESESESKTMKKHMTLLRAMADSESVSPEVLDSLIDRYFGMFERPISCL